MNGNEWLAEQFEMSRAHLRAVAYRMLGSAIEADDAVQECWIRVSRADTAAVEKFEGWLTTVLARVCLNMLRSRKSRREEPLEDGAAHSVITGHKRTGPEDETILADSVGVALLVVLEKLTPAERVAFVLHDVFGVTFDEIAPVVKRSSAAARQLASRARRRVRGTSTAGGAERARLSQQRQVVEAFLSALRAADLEGLLAVLAPGVVRRADKAALPPCATAELRGAEAVAKEALTYTGVARAARLVLVDGSPGFIVAPRGKLRTAMRCTVRKGRITEMEVIADPTRLRKLKLNVPSSSA